MSLVQIKVLGIRESSFSLGKSKSLYLTVLLGHLAVQDLHSTQLWDFIQCTYFNTFKGMSKISPHLFSLALGNFKSLSTLYPMIGCMVNWKVCVEARIWVLELADGFLCLTVWGSEEDQFTKNSFLKVKFLELRFLQKWFLWKLIHRNWIPMLSSLWNDQFAKSLIYQNFSVKLS